MKPTVLLGIVLIVLGTLALVYQGFTYTTKEKAVDLGKVEIMADKQRTVSLPPVLGGVAIVAGVALVVLGQRKS
ncbi:MAG: DUF3185 domain-containing protein [Rhizobacter sp.]|nr:DUF3185 domain-containing protein [Chlorobiales bacterium]